MEHKETSQGDFESTLKKHAHQLVESLEKGQFGDAVQLIHELNQTRDRGLYQEVGKLTRELHSAIVNFQIDPHMPQAEEVSLITDATERLGYVVKLTEAAANRTMDQRRGVFHQVHGAVGCAICQLDHITQTLGGVRDLRNFLGLRHVRVNLKIDDRAMQLTSELAHFLVQAAVTGLIELMDQLHSVAKLAFFKAVDQFAGMFFQGRLKVAL